MFLEQDGENNTTTVHQGDCVIIPDKLKQDMTSLLEELYGHNGVREKDIIAEAQKCVNDNNQDGLIEKLKKLSKKTMDIVKGIAESIAGGILLEWFKTNGFF